MTDRHDSLIEKWRRYRNHTREDRKLIRFAALILPFSKVGLRLFGFRRWKELIETFFLPANLPQSMPMDLQHETALRAVRALRSVEVHGPTTPNCLERSMALWWMLRRAGVKGELQIGARKQGERFEAHAWLELGGEVLNDSAEVHRHYARFDAPIAAAIAETKAGDKMPSD